jgi:regulator of nucleoside diphosphate kinase
MRTAPRFERLANPPRSPAEIYSSAWAAMNEGAKFAVRTSEAFYLKMIASSLDDDLASLLLLKKLKMARKLSDDAPDSDSVAMNSGVEFRFGSKGRSFRQLRHPTACRSNLAVSIASRLGSGLIGLSAGQSVLWPDDEGCLRELCVIAVANAGKTHRADPHAAARTRRRPAPQL